MKWNVAHRRAQAAAGRPGRSGSGSRALRLLLICSSLAALFVGASPPLPLFAQFPNPAPKGPMTFRVTSSGSALNVAARRASIKEPYRSAMAGGAVLALQVQNTRCPPGTRRARKNHVHVFVLFLDETSAENRLDVDPARQSATLTLQGEMRRWEPAADYCNSGDFVEAERGPGRLTLSMTTTNHLTPRNFVAVSGSGRIQGPGLSDTLRPMPNAMGAPIGTSVAVEEFQAQFDLPDLPRATRGRYRVDPRQPMLTLTAAGSKMVDRVPQLVVQMSTGSAVDPLGLTLHRPAVLGGGAVSDATEDTIGAQTFVNQDNDDRDADFDNATRDRDVPGEDELVKVVLKLQPRRVPGGGFGTARLAILQGDEQIRMWNRSTKGARFDHRRELKVPADFTPDGPFVKKEIWVEAVKASATQRSIRLQFTYSAVPDYQDTASITVIGLEKIEWKGDGNSENDDDTLLNDPNHGGLNAAYNPANPTANRRVNPLREPAVRVFPGSRMVNGAVQGPRNLVQVVATLSVKPVEPIKLYFDSYDVDDPSAFAREDPVDDESARDEDNRGEVPGGPHPKAGRFAAESPDGTREVEFTETTATFAFRVTMQPGDNFRIVGNGDKDFLLDLVNKDADLHIGAADVSNDHKQRIVNPYVWAANQTAPDLAEVREAGKYASQTLTVWRYAYVEVDTMEAVRDNKVEGLILQRYPNDPRPGFTRLEISKNLASALGSGLSGGVVDSFSKGEIQIGNGTYPVVGNTANWWANDDVTVRGDVPLGAVGRPFVLKDDDFTSHAFDEGSPLPALVLEGVARLYEPAYIVPDFEKLKPTNRMRFAPYVRNVDGISPADLVPNYRFDHVAYEADENFWTLYLLTAFQGTWVSDGDPDDEPILAAIVDAINGQGAHLFLENMKEIVGVTATPESAVHVDTIAHEMAHLFGAEHGDGLILDQEGIPFSATSLAKMRSARHP